MSKRWQYLTVEMKPGFIISRPNAKTIQEELTKQGNLGWELVNLIVSQPISPVLLIFKKEA